MSTENSFTIELAQLADYRFEVHFDNPGVPALLTDEAAPLGSDTGPNPSRMLTVAVANCLSASLLFALRKFKNEPGAMRTQATTTLARNEHNRLRVTHIAVDIHLGRAATEFNQLDRIVAQFEDFCVVTQSVRAAITVDVRVFDSLGTVLNT